MSRASRDEQITETPALNNFSLKMPGLGVLAGCGLLTGAALADDNSLTWHGITVYGVVDLGLQYETNGAPFNDYHPAGSTNLVAKDSRQSVLGATPSNLSQSKLGVQGAEPLTGDWSAVFKLETFFNPNSGDTSDALKSMTQNNGRTPATQSTNLDSSVAGQLLQTAYAGFSATTFGTATFGRQLTLVADGINKYDPNYGSQAFSLIGMSGAYAGAGDTEDKRLDQSLKYVVTIGDRFHGGALYKFNGSNGGSNTAFQADVGGEIAGLSVDAYYSKIKGAVSAAPLNAAQLAGLPALGIAPDKALSGTISDNTTYSLMAFYKVGTWKLLAGYEHIDFANPAQPLSAGYDDIGGYKLAYVNNTAYVNDKILNVYWAGVRYTVLPGLDLAAAYYGYHQNAYGAGANAGCSTTKAGTCSGRLEAVSFDADYILSARFDVYAGVMYSGVKDGVASGYDFHTTNLNPTIGVRFKF